MNDSSHTLSPTFTVCICTHNRVMYLGPTIEAVLKQELLRGQFDLLVVDNGSSDGTSAMVASRFGCDTRVPVRCIREETPGLSRARNRAIAETTSDIIAFLDDDAIPEPGWLTSLAKAFADADEVDVVGGAVIPVFENGFPDNIPDRVKTIFSPQVASPERCLVSFPRYPYGANIAFRRSAFSRFGAFREDLGYRGNSLMPAEETEFMLRMEKNGGKILFEPKAVVKHLIPASRTTREYLCKRYYMMGRGHHELEKTRRHDVEPWGGREILTALTRAVQKYMSAAKAIRSLRRLADQEAFDKELEAWVAKGRAVSLFLEARDRFRARLFPCTGTK